MSTKNIIAASEWGKKRRETQILDLPSGATVEIKKLNLLEMILANKVPMELVTQIVASSEHLKNVKDGNFDQIKGSELENLNLMINRMTALATVNPTVKLEGLTDGEVSVEDIPYLDKLTIFNNCIDTEGIEALNSFRKK
jgi:hypothetical protein